MEPMAPARPDAYPDRQIHYGNTQPAQKPESAYYDNNGVGFLLEQDDGSQVVQDDPLQQQQAYYQGGYDNQTTQYAQYAQPQPAAPNSQYNNAQYHQYAQNTPHGFTPANAYQPPSSRGYGYGQAVDSFYGSPGAGDPTTHAV
jgi:hypothetical protein